MESREDLIALEADRIFSEELVSEIAGRTPGAGPQQGRICPVRQRQAQCGVQCCRWQTGHCGNKLLTCSSAGDKRRLAAGEASLPESWSRWAGPSGIRSWTSIPPPNCWNRRRSIARPRRRRRGVYPGRRQSGRRYAVFVGGGPEHRDDHWMMVDKGHGGRRCGSTPHPLGKGFPGHGGSAWTGLPQRSPGWRSDSTARPQMEGGGRAASVWS